MPPASGVGYGQLIATICLATYYSSVMATIGRYLIDSFYAPLPWSECQPGWINCMDSAGNIHTDTRAQLDDPLMAMFSNVSLPQTMRQDGSDGRIYSSAYLYFV